MCVCFPRVHSSKYGPQGANSVLWSFRGVASKLEHRQAEASQHYFKALNFHGTQRALYGKNARNACLQGPL